METDIVRPPSERTLEGDMPELKEYLRPGMEVLDVGCGDGAITLDVAKAVKTGRVIGIDQDREVLTMADGRRRQRAGADNVSYQVGDGHSLPFPEHRFDLVYSHTVAHFLLDPLAALKEQARVTKRGGWVVVSGVREWACSVRNPPCPDWDFVVEAWARRWEALRSDFRASGLSPAEYRSQRLARFRTAMTYIDLHAGRQCAGWLAEAGLGNLRVSVKAESVRYPGAPGMEPGTVLDLLPADAPATPVQEDLALSVREMIAEGLLDRSALERAQAAIAAWYRHAHAFFFTTLVFAAGQKV